MERQPNERADLRLGILGLGSIGLRHGRNILQMGQNVNGFDPDEDRRARFAELGGHPAATREGILNSCDILVIATPSGQHLNDLHDAISAGCHVFIEKPLSHTDEGLEAILRQADERGLVIFAGLNQRFNPVIEAAKAKISDGALGQLLWARLLCGSYLPDWRAGDDYRTGYAANPKTGGVLFDVIHEFDIANFLLGPARTINACARNTGLLELSAEDCADVVLEHDSGVRSVLHLDYVTRPGRRRVEIAGSSGLLELDLSGRKLQFYDKDGTLTHEQTWNSSANEDYLNEMKQFIRCITHAETPRCNGHDALNVLRQVLAARQISGLPSA
jgi:predicted dehydrogenase